MNSKALLVGVISLIYMFGANWLYNNKLAHDKCCPTEATTTVAPVPAVKKEREALMFNWSSPKTLISDSKFPTYKAGILAGNKEGRILEITGKYFEGETAPAGYADMGMARAEAIWKERFPEVPETRIRMKSEKVAERAGVRTAEFTNANLAWVDAPKEARKVIETANRALIYFDYNASRKKLNKEVDDYLRKVAERLKNSTEKVIITGHTDTDGELEANQALGLRRAKSVRDILIRYGVANNRITTQSKGETESVESNETATGKALNRRAVVEIVK